LQRILIEPLGPMSSQILLEVLERERHGAILWHRAGRAIALHHLATGRAAPSTQFKSLLTDSQKKRSSRRSWRATARQASPHPKPGNDAGHVPERRGAGDPPARQPLLWAAIGLPLPNAEEPTVWPLLRAYVASVRSRSGAMARPARRGTRRRPVR